MYLLWDTVGQNITKIFKFLTDSPQIFYLYTNLDKNSNLLLILRRHEERRYKLWQLKL